MKNPLSVKLKELRIKKGLTQIELAADLNLGSGFIADIEVGRRLVSITVLMQIADYFNVTPNYLLGYGEE